MMADKIYTAEQVKRQEAAAKDLLDYLMSDKFRKKIQAEPRLKKVKKAEQRQQLLPGLQVGKQLALL
jgi:hypothetical protein